MATLSKVVNAIDSMPNRNKVLKALSNLKYMVALDAWQRQKPATLAKRR